MDLRRNRTPLRVLAALSLTAAITGSTVLAVGVIATPQAGAFTPAAPWEPLPLKTQAGGLVFFNATGHPITSGSITSQPLAAYVEGTSVLNSANTQATLFAYTPTNGVPAGKWSGSQLGGTTHYPNASAPSPLNTSPLPVFTGAATDTPLETYIAQFPNTTTTNSYAGLYVLRLKTSTPAGKSYDAADIKVTGTTWSVVYPTSVTTVTASPTTSHYGTTVKFTATLTPSAATGKVQFLNGTTDIGSPVTVATGKATITAATLPAGHDLVYAVFTPTSGGLYSNSAGNLVYVVSPATTKTTLTTTPTGSQSFGQNVKLTATVTPAITGTVQFKNGTTVLGTKAVSAGSASLTVSTLPVGTLSLTAKFSPASGNYAKSTGHAAIKITVAPTITSFTPTSGPASGGTTVVITGTHLTGATSVKFGTTAATTFLVINATHITAKTKSHAAGTVLIKVTTPGGTATSSTDYTFVAGPTITGFTPTKGPATGGTTVVITGTHFTGATLVTFGTTAATTFSVTNATHITAKTKSHAAGTVLITVTTPGGTATSSTDYTFVAGPTIASFTPTAGPASGGTTVVITGAHFTGAISVKFGTTAAATFSVTDATHITAKTKAHAAGTVKISVTTPGGAAASTTDFSFTAAPVFTADAPPTTANVGKPYSYTFAASGNPTPTYTLSGQPTWLSINSSTGAVTGTPPSGTESFTYSVKATNGVAPPATAGPFTVTVSAVSSSGFDLVGSDGGVFVFPTGQSSGFYGSLPGLGVKVNNIVGMVPTDKGYLLVGGDGGVFAFGAAPFLGSLPGLHVTPAQPIVGIVTANAGKGYFLVGRDGGVFAFGTVPFLGSLPGKGISVNNIIGIASTSSGNGYWLVSATGTVYGFGAAQTLGTAKGSSSPVSAITGTPTGGGYWITTQNGTVDAFGNAKKPNPGTLPALGVSPTHPVIGIVHTADTAGYWLVGSDGGAFSFGDAPFIGSLPGITVHVSDVVGAVPTAGTG